MPADETDDFSAFAGNEHMFFGLKDPYGFIREEVEASLAKQVPGTVVERVETFDTPKFLTLGRKTADPTKIIAAHYAFCVRARLTLSLAGGARREVVDAALTFMFGNVDLRGRDAGVVCRTFFDLHHDAAPNFDDGVLKERFLAFRAGVPDPPAG